jgi:hypothetical protein
MDDAARASLRARIEGAFQGYSVKEKSLQDGRVAYRIEGLPLPPGCKPPFTDVLLVYGSPVEPPAFYIKDQVTLRNGSTPKNMTQTQVDGEPWVQYSANYPFDSSKTISSYVYGRLGRFVQAE